MTTSSTTPRAVTSAMPKRMRMSIYLVAETGTLVPDLRLIPDMHSVAKCPGPWLLGTERSPDSTAFTEPRSRDPAHLLGWIQPCYPGTPDLGFVHSKPIEGGRRAMGVLKGISEAFHEGGWG